MRAEAWAALESADWEGARGAFKAALDEQETPELVEGYSWALWWLNAGEEALAARERAYTLFRERDDRRGAARMASWLASDVVDFRCDTAVSNGWLRRAHRLLDNLQPCAEHGWLALHEGTLALDLSGDTATARGLGARCAEIGRALQDLDLQMLGGCLEGLAAVHEGAVAEGLGSLDEAATAAIAGELDNLVSVGWSCCSLIKACEEVRDYDRAAQWSQQMIAFAQRLGFEPWVRICRSFHAWVLVCQGEWADAELQLVAARERLATTRPPWTIEAVVRLAELRRRQGRLEEATGLFEEAEPHPRALVGLGAVALDRGDVHAALALARRALRSVDGPFEHRRTDAVTPLELLIRCLADAGETEEAAVALQELQGVASRLGTAPARASVAFHAGVEAASRGDLLVARAQFEDSRDLFRRCRAPYDSAQASLELGRCLLKLDERAEADRAAREALREFERLGATHAANQTGQLLQQLAAA